MISALRSLSLVTSVRMKWAWPPLSRMPAAVCSPWSSLMSATTTAAPSWAISAAVTAPMPAAAPVTMALLPSNNIANPLRSDRRRRAAARDLVVLVGGPAGDADRADHLPGDLDRAAATEADQGRADGCFPGRTGRAPGWVSGPMSLVAIFIEQAV